MNNVEQAADLLETTADRFETGEYKWYQGGLYGSAGGVCLVGGLNMTLHNKPEGRFVITFDDPEMIARRAVHKHTGGLLVGDWNDQKERTLAEVIDVLKLAAKDLRNDH